MLKAEEMFQVSASGVLIAQDQRQKARHTHLQIIIQVVSLGYVSLLLYLNCMAITQVIHIQMTLSSFIPFSDPETATT